MSSTTDGRIRVIDLGAMPYANAYEVQCRHHAEMLAVRERAADEGTVPGKPRELGRLLLVEHDPPVITVSRRQGARDHLVATPQQLASLGVTVAETDRGGDITYHGPGQLVVYPIVDLNAVRLGLHDYMRLLEAAVIATCGAFGLPAGRDRCATGVWVPREGETVGEGAGSRCAAAACQDGGSGESGGGGGAKVCAMGVRVRRWVTMHGLALNVRTNLDHFRLIVPCGLVGRPVTSLLAELGERCPAMADVKARLVTELSASLIAASERSPEPVQHG